VHTWRTASGSITEVPVTTIPILKIPFHLSYLVYLSAFSEKLADLYVRFALAICRWRGVAPSFLLHPLDFLGPGEAPELAFFPGMNLPLEKKLRIASSALARISKHFKVVSMQAHVAGAVPKMAELAATSVRN